MFKRGDIVCLISQGDDGAPIKVQGTTWRTIYGIYVKSGINIERCRTKFQYYKDKTMTNPYKVGDEVKLKRGNTKMYVHEINGKYIRASYNKSSEYGLGNRRIHTDYTYFNLEDQFELFETREGPATLIGKTRNGTYVMEKLDDDCEIIYQRHKPQKHMAHTVELQNIVDKYRFHRVCPEGKVKKGDLIKRPNGKLYSVTALNTRAHITQELEGEIMTGRAL